MAVWNFGSINADYFYSVPHIPGRGETLAATNFATGLGGKGANSSVAAARAGAEVFHIGAVGADGAWATERLASYGVDTRHVATVKAPTGHAIINVAEDGENAIVILAGANVDQPSSAALLALGAARPGDYLMLQNETAHQATVAEAAQKAGLKVVYSAAPFSERAVRNVMRFADLLVMNEIEAKQLSAALDTDIAKLDVPHILITKGSDGASWLDTGAGTETYQHAFKVDPVDTTGAGDTFAGYMVAGLDQGLGVAAALRLASAAAALKVTRAGTADAIPARQEVEEFLAAQPA